jgi:hypothetical protein
MEEKGARMGNSDANLTRWLQFLGQGGDVKWAEFHCSYAYIRNETPTPPFI